MTTFQAIALLLTVIWLGLVVTRFRRSSVVLIGGLGLIGVYTLTAFAIGKVSSVELGLGAPHSWLVTLGLALAGLVVLLVYSPLADWLASQVFKKPPILETFGTIQRSRTNLVAGIAVAWLLGGILEELVARGIVLRSVEAGLAQWAGVSLATGVAVCVAAAGAGGMHLYQGPRAMLIIAQLSLLFGVLFVVSSYNLWVVMLCHGMYDTIAFVRFAQKKSKYSKVEDIK